MKHSLPKPICDPFYLFCDNMTIEEPSHLTNTTQPFGALHKEKIIGMPGLLNNSTKLIDCTFPFKEAVTSKDLSNTVICAVILSMKHNSTSKPKVFERSKFHATSALATKRQRISSTSGYDRLLICGDVATKAGNCFAILFSNLNESKNRMSNFRNTIAIGQIICLYEPQKANRTLGDHLPIIESKYEFGVIPSTYPYNSFVPEIKLDIPSALGEHRYFVYHDLTEVEINQYRVVFEDVSCEGRLCDRSMIQEPGKACGCFTIGHSGRAIVGECCVQLKIDDEVEEVDNFRSLRLSEVFFADFAEYARKDTSLMRGEMHGIRERVDQMVSHVNASGGWTVVGWFKKGDVVDASNADEKIVSESVTLHMSLFLPRDGDIRANKKAQFEALRIK